MLRRSNRIANVLAVALAFAFVPLMLAEPARAGAALKAEVWPTGQVLRVRFLDGSQANRDEALSAMRQWEKAGANVRFVESSDADSEVRVHFARDGGSWSLMRGGAAHVPLDRPTMTLAVLDPMTPANRRAAIHEAGHVLGFIHEHQSPNVPFDWTPAASVVYQLVTGWDDSMIESQVLRRYPADDVVAGPFDRESVMLYPVFSAAASDGRSMAQPLTISPGDAAMARRLYPPTK